MDSVNSLSSASAALAALQAETSTAATTQATETSFDDLLSGMMSSSSSSDMQQQIFDGLMDGSLNVTDSQKLVSALLSTLETADTSAGSTFGIDTATQNALDALLGLSDDSEAQSSLLTQSETLAALQQTGDDAMMLEYYQAMASLAEAQKKTLGEG